MKRIIGTDTETDKGYAILVTKPHAWYEVHSWEECIDFVSDDPQVACWNSDYDAQAMMKWLPKMVRDRIALIGMATHRGYRIKYIAHKFMKVWYRDRLQFTMYDMKQFYNCSLAVAAKKLGVEQKGSIPQAWYKQMKARLADPRTRNVVLDYALRDARVLQQIIDRTVESFKLAGLRFERPYSNASFAERYFRKRFNYRRNKEVEKWARRAYHGGRIECIKAGYFPIAYHYDIHSAYPSIIAGLVKPNGKWIYEKSPEEIREDAVYALCDCTITIPKSEIVGPIPVRRRSGAIFYPVGTFRKVITLTEFRYLTSKAFPVRIHAAWVHIWPKWDRPFAEIYEIYRKRKSDKRVDYAFKIVMNSVYGKLAQVLVSRKRVHAVTGRTEIFDGRIWKKKEHIKEHTSFVYASEITAQPRIKLLRDIPQDVLISYSTDGVFTTTEIPIATGDALGDWSDVQVVHDLLVVGSGVYTYRVRDEKTGRWKRVVRFRGFSPRIDLRAMLKRAGRRHSIGMHVIRNTSLRQAVGMRHASLNVLKEMVRYMDVNFDTKRHWESFWNAGELATLQFSSKPWVYYKPINLRR